MCWPWAPIRRNWCGTFKLKLLIYPLKGYSLTIDIQDEGRAPVSTVADETIKVAITRLGDRASASVVWLRSPAMT